MTTMQQNYLKKVLKAVGAIAYGIACALFTIIGGANNHWTMWIGLGLMGLPATLIAFACIYIPIATEVWHWRLMAICENAWQAELLDHWWFWMYRSEKWFDYLKTDIEENFSDTEEMKQMTTDFLHALARVKKPKLL